jgi:hypothetical protein
MNTRSIRFRLTAWYGGILVVLVHPRHTSAEFVDFLAQIVVSQPAGRQIHVIADNLSAHKTKKVFDFLEANPTVRIHYTPTYSSWLNQVEIWFSKGSQGEGDLLLSAFNLAGPCGRRYREARLAAGRNAP